MSPTPLFAALALCFAPTASAFTGPLGALPVYPELAAPSVVKLVDVGDDHVTLKWAATAASINSPATAERYRVYRDGLWVATLDQRAIVLADATTADAVQLHYTDWDVEPSTSYSYTVVAEDLDEGHLSPDTIPLIATTRAPNGSDHRALIGDQVSIVGYFQAGIVTTGIAFEPVADQVLSTVRTYHGDRFSIWEEDCTGDSCVADLLQTHDITAAAGQWTEHHLVEPVLAQAGRRYVVSVHEPEFIYIEALSGHTSFDNDLGVVTPYLTAADDSLPEASSALYRAMIDVDLAPVPVVLEASYTLGTFRSFVELLSPEELDHWEIAAVLPSAAEIRGSRGELGASPHINLYASDGTVDYVPSNGQCGTDALQYAVVSRDRQTVQWRTLTMTIEGSASSPCDPAEDVGDQRFFFVSEYNVGVGDVVVSTDSDVSVDVDVTLTNPHLSTAKINDFLDTFVDGQLSRFNEPNLADLDGFHPFTFTPDTRFCGPTTFGFYRGIDADGRMGLGYVRFDVAPSPAGCGAITQDNLVEAGCVLDGTVASEGFCDPTFDDLRAVEIIDVSGGPSALTASDIQPDGTVRITTDGTECTANPYGISYTASYDVLGEDGRVESDFFSIRVPCNPMPATTDLTLAGGPTSGSSQFPTVRLDGFGAYGHAYLYADAACTEPLEARVISDRLDRRARTVGRFVDTAYYVEAGSVTDVYALGVGYDNGIASDCTYLLTYSHTP